MTDSNERPVRSSILFISQRPVADPVLTGVARELGQTIVQADSLDEALDQVQRREFALVLVGYADDAGAMLDVIRAVRANSRSSLTPIVAMGLPLPLPFPQEALYEAGVIAVLTEPLSPTILRAKAQFYIAAFDTQVERRRAEASLDETRNRLQRIIEAAELGIWSWEIGDDRVEADERVADLFGVPREERASAPLARYLAAIHPDDVDATTAQISAAIAARGGYGATYRIRLPAGGWRWVMARGHVEPDEQGLPGEVRGVVIDATRQLQAEEQLRASEERYRTVFDSIDEGLCVIDMLFDDAGVPCDYRFIEANPAFIHQTGLVDAVGKTIRQLVPHHEQHWFDIYAQVAATGQAVRFENEAKGLERWYDVYATRLGGPFRHRVAVLFTDITERRQSDAALRQMAADLSEANRLKTEFLATLAHELRNPLAPIRSGLDLLRMGPRDAAAAGRVHGMMDRQLGHLIHLVDDLLDIARITRGKIELKKQAVPLATVVTMALETSVALFEAHGHRIEVELPEDPLELEADVTRLVQVLSNLLNNAAKYTPHGGVVRLRAWREDAQAVIAVTDSGIGIPPEAIGSVFEMFTQVRGSLDRAQGGLGIGLSLVRRLVELHGGRVSAHSAGQGQGSTFTVRLPLRPGTPHAPHAPGRDAPADAAPQPMRVLVVDDNGDAADSLAALLGALGHTTRIAHDGPEGLRLAGEFRPDLAFLDIGLPGMSGYELARALRQAPLLANTILIALTGWGARSDQQQSQEAGFDQHLTKPVSLEALEQALGASYRASYPLSGISEGRA